jgi:glutathione S-transferase
MSRAKFPKTCVSDTVSLMSTKPTLIIGSKNYSSWSLRPWMHAKKLGVDFEERLIAFDVPNYREKIRAASPSQRVPVLLVDDVAVCESLAICEYLSDITGTGLPADPIARALARSAASEMHSGFQTLREQCSMNVRGRDRRVGSSPELTADIDRIDRLWRESRERWGAGGPWLFGSYSLADAMFAPVAFRFRTYGAELTAESRDYLAHVLADPVMSEWSDACDAEAHRLPAVDEIGR